MNDRELQAKMLAAQHFMLERAIHPQTDLVYGKIDLTDPDRWQNAVFPSAESIANRFCDDSETPNVSNCAIAAGYYLGTLVDCYDVTELPYVERYARTIFAGAKRLSEVSPRIGFIARGVLPADGVTHLLNSSVDQYTYYVYGLWRYYHSPICGEKERAVIRRILHDICAMIEADGTILATNGIPAPVSDLEAIRSDRSSRILEVYRVGYDVTGEEHWLGKYREKVVESDHARLRSLLDPYKVKYPYSPRDEHSGLTPRGNLQTQLSLVPLYDMEADITLKGCYVEAMRLNAKIVEWGADSRPQGLQIILLAQNRSLTGDFVPSPADTWYLERLQERCRRVLSEAPEPTMSMNIENPRSSWALVSLYWTATKLGLFTYQA